MDNPRRLVQRLEHFFIHAALRRRDRPMPGQEHRLKIDLPSLLVVPPWKGTHVAPTAPVEGAPPLISQFDWSRVRTPGAQERCAYPSSPTSVCALGEQELI